MTNFPSCLAPDDCFLNGGHSLGRQFHPQVSARHHYAIGLLEDGVEVGPRFGLFDLGYDRELYIVVLQVDPQPQHIVSPPHK